MGRRTAADSADGRGDCSQFKGANVGMKKPSIMVLAGEYSGEPGKKASSERGV